MLQDYSWAQCTVYAPTYNKAMRGRCLCHSRLIDSAASWRYILIQLDDKTRALIQHASTSSNIAFKTRRRHAFPPFEGASEIGDVVIAEGIGNLFNAKAPRLELFQS